MLSGDTICPAIQLRRFNGNKEKTFEINSQVYRKISSVGHYLIHEGVSKSIFITLTFPPFLKKHKLTHKIFEDEILNTYFSKFVENLTKNYFCNGYVGVRERGTNGDRVHYHLICSMPFTSFTMLNNVWCGTIQDICHYSDHALTTKRKKVVIYDTIRALRYLCKYISKAKGKKSTCRLVFISNNILSHRKPGELKKVDGLHQKNREPNYVKTMRKDSESMLDKFKFDYQKQTSDFTTCFRITENSEFERFCDEFLYPFFELSVKRKILFKSEHKVYSN
jgi:hypothetical protein